MPSSMIFISLVVLWLLILVPTIARRRQEVVRPTLAALSGRVLTRTAAGQEAEREADGMSAGNSGARSVALRREGERAVSDPVPERHSPPDDRGDNDGRRPDDRYGEEHRVDRHGPEHDRSDDVDDEYDADWDGYEPGPDDRGWERPPPRYRPGRGGFDPEAAAMAARTRYAFRQRLVLVLLVGALVTGLVAGLAVPGMWWPHAAVDLVLVGYLGYLRRQVRMEETIRARRSSRMAGTRRPPAADDPELDAWARRGRDATPSAVVRAVDVDPPTPAAPHGYGEEPDGDVDESDDLPDPDRVPGTGEPVGLLESRGTMEGEPALPRLPPIPTPPPPPGTVLVSADDDDPDLHDLAGPSGTPHRRAVGA